MKPVLIGSVAAVILAGAGLVFFLLRDHLPQMGGGRPRIEAIPAKETKADRWGLIDLDGNFIVSNEWENEPSIPSDGIVRVKTRDGRFEFYTAEKKPRQIGESYKAATVFGDGLAGVVKDKESVQYIDRTGKTAFELREVGGYVIEGASNFREGLAIVLTDRGECGYINTKGEVAVKPTYRSCMPFRDSLAMVGTVEAVAGSKEERRLIGFIDKEGKVVIKLRSGIDYSLPNEGLIAYSDGNEEWGVMNLEGEKVIKPSSRFRRISWFENGHAAFSDGTYFGVLNAKGEVVVRPKFEGAFVTGDLVLVSQREKKGFIDFEGNEVIRPEYDAISPFLGNRAFAKEGSRWVLIDRKGKYVSKRDFEEIGDLMPDYLVIPDTVDSDYFDAGSVVGALPLSELSDRTFAGVNAWATIDELMAKLGLAENDLGQTQSVALGARPAGSSGSFSLQLLFDRQLKGWFSRVHDPEARCGGVRLEVDLRGKAVGRGSDVAQLILSRLESLRQHGITLQNALSTQERKLFANQQQEPVVVVQIGPNQVAVHYQFPSDTMPSAVQ